MADGSTPAPDDGFLQAFVSAVDNRALELTILPTEKCNFRCTYCYEDFALGKMPLSVQDDCIALIRTRAPELTRLDIRWFGGEPLAALDVVERMSGAFCEIAAAHANLHHTGAMTTNGYLLTPAVARRLAAVGIGTFQISLDGPRARHDVTRIMKNGRGSFDVIMANLMALRRSDLDISIVLRLHLTPENASDLPDFVRTLAQDFLTDPRFTLFMMPIARLGGPNDAKTGVLDSSRARALMDRLKQIVTEIVGELAQPPAAARQAWSVCYAAKPNAFVLRADGSVGKCTVALASKDNQVGRLGAGGRVEFDQSRHKRWLLGWQYQDPHMLHCPMEAIDFNHP